MKQIEIQMFRAMLVYVEGKLDELKRGVDNLIEEYKLSGRSNDIGEIPDIEDFRGMTLELEGRSEFSRVYVIWYNTDDRRPKKTKIVTITHEIRHVVDLIIERNNVRDRETAACLTGWLSGELLS